MGAVAYVVVSVFYVTRYCAASQDCLESSNLAIIPFHPFGQDMPEDTFYTVENMRLETGEMEAFIIDVLSGVVKYVPP